MPKRSNFLILLAQNILVILHIDSQDMHREGNFYTKDLLCHRETLASTEVESTFVIEIAEGTEIDLMKIFYCDLVG